MMTDFAAFTVSSHLQIRLAPCGGWLCAGAFLGALGVPAAEGSTSARPGPQTQHFFSRPDLKPPAVHLAKRATGVAPGYIFVAPKLRVTQAGPEILDNNGQVVWFRPLDAKDVADFRVQTYGGKSVLTWWRGRAPGGVGGGYYVIYGRHRSRDRHRDRAGSVRMA
jgi:hypothetical protein